MSSINPNTVSLTFSKVPGFMPDNFPARLFRGGNSFRGLNTIYTVMDRFVPAYVGGLWEAYEASNGALFAGLDDSGSTHCRWTINGFAGELSWEAASIFCTAIAIGAEWEQSQSDHLAHGHSLLMEVVAIHPERETLYRAFD